MPEMEVGENLEQAPATPSISINGSEVLRVFEGTIPRARFGDDSDERFNKLLSILRLLLGNSTQDSSKVEELTTSVESLKASLRDLNQWRTTVMATLEQMNSAITALNEATTKVGTAITAVAARIEALEESVTNMGLTQEQEDNILNQLTGVHTNLSVAADSLTQMGKSTDTPVPVEPPPPIEPPTPVEPPDGPPAEPTPINPNPSANPNNLASESPKSGQSTQGKSTTSTGERGQARNVHGEPTGAGSAGTPPSVSDGTNQTPFGNPPQVAVDPKNDDGTKVSEPQRGQETKKK